MQWGLKGESNQKRLFLKSPSVAPGDTYIQIRFLRVHIYSCRLSKHRKIAICIFVSTIGFEVNPLSGGGDTGEGVRYTLPISEGNCFSYNTTMISALLGVFKAKTAIKTKLFSTYHLLFPSSYSISVLYTTEFVTSYYSITVLLQPTLISYQNLILLKASIYFFSFWNTYEFRYYVL